MTTDRPTVETAWQRTVCWRTAQLRAVGLDGDRAAQLAADGRWDLHALLDLIDRGCPPQVAVRIVAPLDCDDPL